MAGPLQTRLSFIEFFPTVSKHLKDRNSNARHLPWTFPYGPKDSLAFGSVPETLLSIIDWKEFKRCKEEIVLSGCYQKWERKVYTSSEGNNFSKLKIQSCIQEIGRRKRKKKEKVRQVIRVQMTARPWIHSFQSTEVFLEVGKEKKKRKNNSRAVG